MKYYIYISDTKVDMLYPQIPKPLLKKIASSLSIDLKLLGAEVRVGAKKNTSDETRYAKVRIVSEYIEKHLDVGSVNAPSTYCKGTIQMNWGPIGDHSIYFTGATSQTSIGLGGSLKHVIGANIGSPPVGFPSSEVGTLLATIFGATQLIERAEKQGRSNTFSGKYLGPIVKMRDFMKGPEQRVEFLAKTLLQGPLDSSDRKEYEIIVPQAYVVLGTPIYVAIDD